MSDIEEDEYDEIRNAFDQAANYLQEIHSELTSTDLLEFYGLYKQATCGPCNTPKPGMFNLQGKSKWNAWNDLKDMEKVEAMERYIAKITQLRPDWNKGARRKTQWVCQSMPTAEPEAEIHESNKSAFDFVKEKNLSKLKAIAPSDLNALDESGMGLIHWAADRDTVDILEYLLSSGADVDLRDADGQTALHYASSCGHVESLKVLLKFGADRSILDSDGCSSLDVAFDERISDLLKS